MAITVLHITASATPGGGPEHLYRLAQHLPQAEVRCLAAAPREEPYWELYAERMGRGALVEIPHRAMSLPALWRLVAFARAMGADILHSHGKGAGIYGRLAGMWTGIPCVHTFHGIHIAGGSAVGRRAYLALERWLGRRTARCVAVSAGEAAQVEGLGFCPRGRLAVVPNGVLIPQAPAERDPHGEGRYRVVHMSRFDRLQKNSLAVVDVALALRAMGRLEGFAFELLGEGEELPELRRRVEAAGLEAFFRFAGYCPQPREALRRSFAYLSTSRWEGLPLAVLESMAEGLPVVASDVVGNRDAVVDGRTGWLYPLADPAQAARRLADLRDDPAAWRGMSAQAAARARAEFDVRIMAGRILECYRQALALRS